MDTGKIKKIGLVVLFVVLLAFPVVRRAWNNWQQKKESRQEHAEIIKRYGFYLQNVAKEAGITFKHESPMLDPKLDNIMPIIASMGASVSVTDFDNDGWEDLYFTNSRYGTKNALYRNLGNGKFEDVAGKLGVADVNKQGTGVSMGAVWGDYDNDGYEDLFIYKWGKCELFHNDQGKGFTNVTDQIPLPKWANANTAVWFDYDHDGKLDLFVGGYYGDDIDLWHLKSTRIMPTSFEYANNGGRNYLFHNLGNGHFEEVAEKTGLTSHRWTLAVSAADVNNDGWPDLVVANDYGVDQLYINEQGKGFKDIGPDSRIGFAPKSGMNVTMGDVLNRGNLDIYITNISEPGVLLQGNNLWVPDLGSSGDKMTYRNLANNLGIDLGGWSYGAQFGDLNNDGHLDLYVANGYVSGKKHSMDYWYDYSKVAVGNQTIIADTRNWPHMNGKSLSGYQRNKIWVNDGAGRFQEVGEAVGGHEVYDSRSVALADLWNTGDQDIIVANQNGPVLLYKNTVDSQNKWIGFILTGTKSNRSAIDAKVDLYWDNQHQRQVVSGGGGFCSENQRRVYFGLGKKPDIKKAVISWPSGTVQTIVPLKPDSLYHIREE